MVGRAGYKKLNVFRNASYKTLTTLRDKDKLTTSLWQELSDFRMYIDAVDPDYNSVVLMKSATWQVVEIIMLRLNHVMISAVVSAIPKPSVTTTTITLSNMETTNFLKYVSVVLTEKS